MAEDPRIPHATTLAGSLIAIAIGATIAHVIAIGTGGGGLDGLASDGFYNVAVVTAALACLLRAVAVRRDRLAWALIGAGTVSWAGGELYWSFGLPDQGAPYPSVADLLYLLNYPLAIAGVGILARRWIGGARLQLGTIVDGAIAGVGAAALGAALLGPALAILAREDPARAFVDAAYPLGDVVMIAAVAAAAVVLGWRRDWIPLALGLIAIAAADGLYLYLEATSGYVEGTLLDSGWLIGAALLALAAWQPDQHRPLAGGRTRSAVLPSLSGLLAIGLLTVDHFERLSEPAVLLAAATLVLAVLRLAIDFAEYSRLLRAARTDARTDALTGLGNRRLLIADLDAIAVATEDGGGEHLFAIFDLDGFKSYNDSFGHGAGDLLLQRLGLALAATVEGHGGAYRLGGDEFCVLARVGAAERDRVIAAASDALSESGEGFAISASHGTATIPTEASTPADALRLADRRLYVAKGASSRSFEQQARNLLLAVLRERRPGLGAHMEGVSALAAELARRLRMDAEDIDVVARAAELHDIGKMAIPDDVLEKRGPLSPEEWKLIRRHTVIGERMLSTAPALAPVARLVRWSHERWDGGGYPDGIAGTEIPVGARIIAICDAFEAMIEERPYRRAMSVSDALAELRRHAGSQFDPDLVGSLVEIVLELPPVQVAGRA